MGFAPWKRALPFLSGGAVVRQGRQPLLRGYSLWPDLPHFAGWQVGGIHRVRRRAERSENPQDGTIYVADHKLGILKFDPKSAQRTVVIDRPNYERFKGVNDLTFARNGDLYFTDQGRSDLRNPNGTVYRLRADGTLDTIWSGLASPNGLVLNNKEDALYIGVTNRVVGVGLGANYSIGKAFYPFLQWVARGGRMA